MEEHKLDIEIKPEVAEGVYSSLAIISHSHTEFVIDFAQVLPAMPKPCVKSRVILSPFHAKRLLAALQDNIEKYEAVNGPIDDNLSGNGQFNTITPLAKA